MKSWSFISAFTKITNEPRWTENEPDVSDRSNWNQIYVWVIPFPSELHGSFLNATRGTTQRACDLEARKNHQQTTTLTQQRQTEPTKMRGVCWSICYLKSSTAPYSSATTNRTNKVSKNNKRQISTFPKRFKRMVNAGKHRPVGQRVCRRSVVRTCKPNHVGQQLMSTLDERLL